MTELERAILEIERYEEDHDYKFSLYRIPYCYLDEESEE